MKSYYCSVDSIFRRTPCIHEMCRRLQYEPQVVAEVRQTHKEIMGDKRG